MTAWARETRGRRGVAEYKEQRQWVTVPEASKITGVSERYLLDLVNANRIRSERATGEKKDRGVWLIYLPSLRDFISK